MAKRKQMGYDWQLLHNNSHMSWDVKFQRDKLYTEWLNILTGRAISRFRWVNLPGSLTSNAIERALIKTGMAQFSLHPVSGELIVLPANMAGMPDIYGDPIKVIGTAVNGFTQNLPIEECAIVWDFASKADTTMVTLSNLAHRLADLDMAINIQNNNQKDPQVYVVPEELRHSIMNMYAERTEGEPVFFVTNSMANVEPISLTTDRPYTALELAQVKQTLILELDKKLGIMPEPFEKVNVAMQQKTDEATELNRLAYLDIRREYLNRVNTMFNTDIQVFWKRDSESQMFDANTNLEIAHQFDLIANDSQAGDRNNAVDNDKIEN